MGFDDVSSGDPVFTVWDNAMCSVDLIYDWGLLVLTIAKVTIDIVNIQKLIDEELK